MNDIDAMAATSLVLLLGLWIALLAANDDSVNDLQHRRGDSDDEETDAE